MPDGVAPTFGGLRMDAASLRWAAPMRSALELAEATGSSDDVPVGAVVVDAAGQLTGSGANCRERDGDPTAHAEILALRAAARSTGAWRLAGSTLVVTLEPCPMCAGAAVAARVDRVVYGAPDPKAGAAGSVWELLRDRRLNHRPEVVGGVLADESADLLRRFFAQRRPGGPSGRLSGGGVA